MASGGTATLPPRLANLQLIPRIMRAQGPAWSEAADLLDKWFAAPAKINPPPKQYVYIAGEADTKTITMRWLLTFPRARKAYNDLYDGWLTEATKSQIDQLLRRLGKLTAHRTDFGNLTHPVTTINENYVTYRQVGAAGDPLDGLLAALGRFQLRVCVQGSVVPVSPLMPVASTRSMSVTSSASTGPVSPAMSSTTSGSPASGGRMRHEVQIDKVAIYVFDSFDFNGDQMLGFWNANTNQVRKWEPLGSGFFQATNSLFREWRNSTGRGGDFWVFSAPKILTRTPPDTFVI